MSWLELHQELREHPKVGSFATLHRIHSSTAKGILINLWTWCLKYAKDGDLSKFSDVQIVEACDPPPARKENLVKNLVATRWLDAENGKKSVHNWKKFGLRILEQSRKRMAKSRKNKDLQLITVTQPLRDRDALLSYLSIIPDLSNHTILSSDNFFVSFNEWIIYRVEKRKPLTQRQITKELIWLSKQPNPIECIDRSIRNGWQGLFEDKKIPMGKVLPDIKSTQRFPCPNNCGQTLTEQGKESHLMYQCPKTAHTH